MARRGLFDECKFTDLARNHHIRPMLSCVVDELGKCHNGDVGVRSLGNGLMGDPGVGDEEEPGLPEGSLDLIGEGARAEAASNGGAADVSVENTEFTAFKHLII